MINKKVFIHTFYELWENEGFGKPDYDSPYPWGIPWALHNRESEGLKELYESFPGENTQEIAKNYFESVKNEIQSLINEETN